jgi:cephalosporin-C deacetylase
MKNIGRRRKHQTEEDAMPLIDLPVSELLQYQCHGPLPKDFDAFWDRALAELHATAPDIQLVPSDYQVPGVECFDLWFTGTRGARIHAKYLRPSNKCACPAVLQFHGYTGNAGDWTDKLAWVAAGFCVAALDCRGQGGLSEDVGGVKGNTFRGHIIRGLESGPDHLLFRDIYLDTARLADVVMGFPEVDESRVSAMGASQGGGLTLACAALAPKVHRAAPLYPFLCDFRRVWEMDLDILAYEEIRTWFKFFDPRHHREEEFFHTLAYIDLANLAPRIEADLLLGCGLLDNVCPPSTQFAAYNRIRTKKRVLLYPDFGHEGIPGFNDEVMRFLLE